MQEHIIKEQTCDMGNGRGEYLFTAQMTLEQVLKWFEKKFKELGHNYY